MGTSGEPEILIIGTRVRKSAGDYAFDGEIRATVLKRSGAVRYVVEDDRGLLLILSRTEFEVLA